MFDTTIYFKDNNETFDKTIKLYRDYKLYEKISLEEVIILRELMLLSKQVEQNNKIYFLFKREDKNLIQSKFKISNSKFQNYIKKMYKQEVIRYHPKDSKTLIIKI